MNEKRVGTDDYQCGSTKRCKFSLEQIMDATELEATELETIIEKLK